MWRGGVCAVVRGHVLAVGLYPSTSHHVPLAAYDCICACLCSVCEPMGGMLLWTLTASSLCLLFVVTRHPIDMTALTCMLQFAVMDSGLFIPGC